MEQTTIKDPTHTYRLRDPSDPTSLEIVSTVMVERFVKKADLKPVEPTTPTITYEFLIEKWAYENYKGKKTRKNTNTNCARFVAWLGHDDPTRVTLADCIRYKDFLVDARKAGKMADQTIKNQLITLRSVFKYASDNNHLGEGKTNPMVGVKFTAGKGKEIREYSLEERHTILITARGQKPVVKWLTWLCAFTGARIEEIADATTHDIECVDGIWCIKIRENNRSTDQTIKNERSDRTVPLHGAILSEGFITDYYMKLKPGALFPMLNIDCYGRRGARASEKVWYFVRKVLKITDNTIHPSHSLRHFVITELAKKEYKIPLHVIAEISGHSIITGVIAVYLHASISEKKDAIEKLPGVF